MYQGEMRHTHFPYCLEKMDDGRYVLLNRKYKPIGFMVGEHVTYEDHPVGMRLPGLTAAVASQLDVKGRDGLDKIWLYDQGSVPTASPANLDAYFKRLGLLMTLKVHTETA